MSVKDILRWPDPRLSRICAPVGAITEETAALTDDMLETMYAAQGRGLAAPQIGVMRRVFVMDTTWKEGTRRPQVFVNPEITEAGFTKTTQSEGCLSIPGITTDVARPNWVELMWTGLDQATRLDRFEGFAALCIQHEMDHLDGIVTFDRLSPTARAEAEAAYFAIQ